MGQGVLKIYFKDILWDLFRTSKHPETFSRTPDLLGSSTFPRLTEGPKQSYEKEENLKKFVIGKNGVKTFSENKCL